jgi:nucleoside diphosphate kinase
MNKQKKAFIYEKKGIDESFYNKERLLATIKDCNIDKPIKTTRECYDYILSLFNENDINFVIIRGFRFLPNKMDTDIDMVIHPDSYTKFTEICKLLKLKKLININSPKEYHHEYIKKKKTIIKKYYYHPLITSKSLEGKYYRFDTYSDLFFYKNGEGITNEALVVNSLFKHYLFQNKQQVNNYFIPHPIHEIILLIYRSIYDKQNKWAKKHMNRVSELLENINTDEFNYFSNMCFSKQQNVLANLQQKEFNSIKESDQNLNLFIIRKKGLEKEIVESISNKIISEGYDIIDKILVSIGDTNKFYKNFYENFDTFQDNILETNKNQCLVIVTNLPDKNKPGKLKTLIRNEYSVVFPDTPGLPGNIIHSSDSSHDCNNELDLIFKEHITNFKHIGTYYCFHEKN